MQPLHRNCIKIHTFEASDVDTPLLGCGPRAAEGEDAAGGAEVVPRRAGVELVERQVLKRRQQAELVILDPVKQPASTAADRAVADSHMIEVGLDLESDPAAVTGTLVNPAHAADARATTPHLHPSNDFSIFRRLCGAGVLPIQRTAIKE
jgi:hypothetical protein